MKPVASTYDDMFFREHIAGADEYRRVANCINSVLGPLAGLSVLDVGCGSGECLERLGELGAKILGIEGSETALKYSKIPHHTQIMDIRAYVKEQRPSSICFDLVYSTEVAEHLPESAADTFVDLLCDHAKSTIFLTAAPPGQEGHEHINLQPFEYWISKLNDRGWKLNWALTSKMREELGSSRGPQWQVWYRNNALVFRNN